MDVLLTPPDVTELDRQMVQTWDISEIQLMERAASAAHSKLRNIITDCYPDCSTIVVVCGNGNNGGDGFCIARMLAQNFNVTVIWSGSQELLSPSASVNYAQLPKTVKSIAVNDASSSIQVDLVIDAVLGVGASLPVREPARSLIAYINALTCPIVSIDMPSGLDARSGRSDSESVHADHTITFDAPKVGLLRGDGPFRRGQVHLVSFGIPDVILKSTCHSNALDIGDIAGMLPERTRHTSKFDYGRVAVIGGTRGMRGAPSLSAHAALAVGAGIVDLVAPSIHPLTPREVITHELMSHDDGTISAAEEENISSLLARATAIAIGPGLGSNYNTIAMLSRCLNNVASDVPIVIDADGLRCIEHIGARAGTIITPHMGEFARILGQDRESITADYVELAEELANRLSYVVHVKHVPSVTTNGPVSTYLDRGTPAMATAGSGDVLTGIIVGLVAQGIAQFDAARLGAFLHAIAGENLIREHQYRSIVAHELIEAVRGILQVAEPMGVQLD